MIQLVGAKQLYQLLVQDETLGLQLFAKSVQKLESFDVEHRLRFAAHYAQLQQLQDL